MEKWKWGLVASLSVFFCGAVALVLHRFQPPPRIEADVMLHHNLVGCYRLSHDLQIDLPTWVVLDSALVPTSRTSRTLDTNAPETIQKYVFRSWQVDAESKRVQLTFSTGFGGYLLDMTYSDEAMNGFIYQFLDIQPSWSRRGRVTAERGPCEEEGVSHLAISRFCHIDGEERPSLSSGA